MKIEIAELLIYSYLKHIESCRIVQTNWKTSGKWTITEFDKERAKLLFEKIKKSPSFSEIFKNNTFEQLIKQAEIDVLGLNTTENTIYGIDVAFHTAGLNYGSSKETASRIMKKIFRTIFIMQTYFKDFDKFNSFFVTPKVNPANKIIIDKLIKEAKEIINDEFISIDFISNEYFYSNIVDPLTNEINDENDENDTMELFSRAVKLLQLDNRKTNLKPSTKTKNYKNQLTTEKRTVTEMKIGQFVQYSVRKAYELNLITENEINNLQKVDYSKRIFNQNTEVLRTKNRTIIDDKGRKRYYAKEVFCGNYHLTAQWVEPQWELFLKWLREINYDYIKNAP